MERQTKSIRTVTAVVVAIAFAMASTLHAQRDRLLIPNEQGCLQVRDTGDYCPAPLPRSLTPPTVSTKEGVPEWPLSLDEAIRIALKNADVVRVLSGVGAASSGQTIYSPGIVNTGIDQARATFDPNVSVRNDFARNERPVAFADPFDPMRTLIGGTRSDDYQLAFNMSKRFMNGADANFAAGTNRTRLSNFAGALNPRSDSGVSFSLTQPLLQGYGTDVNTAPIVLAFLDTESSYFRLKSSLQNLVVGVIQGYWDLVQARTELWVIQQQIKQTEAINERALLQKEIGSADQDQLAQTTASLANFRANLISSEATILNRVASLRAILGLPPGSDFTIIPTTPPIQERMDIDWNAIVELAEQRRPDLVELKLVLEADQQRILQARNQAQPRLDAVALYQWNGLEGVMPVGDRIESLPGQHTDWSLGVNFSVPLTLRSERARLRQTELLLANDRLNLKQGLLQASHTLASVLRTIDQLHEQAEAFRIAREASEASLQQQFARYSVGTLDIVDFLLALNTWASSVTSEARAITQLNSTLATLEAESGTILETHGVRMFEERYCSLGPLGRFHKGRQYPSAVRPTENATRYADGAEASENAFNLQVPVDLTKSPDARELRDEREASELRDRIRKLPPVPENGLD